MLSKFFRFCYIFLLSVCFLFVTVGDASAYVRTGGKYSQDIYGKKYFNGTTTYSSQQQISHWQSVNSAVSSWNDTENTRVWFQSASIRSESIMDFLSADLQESGTFAITFYYDGNTKVPIDAIYYWAEITMNTGANLSGMTLVQRAELMRNTAAHEEGHALGLAHNFWQNRVLMTSNPKTSYSFGIVGPTDDEVAGVQTIYGEL